MIDARRHVVGGTSSESLDDLLAADGRSTIEAIAAEVEATSAAAEQKQKQKQHPQQKQKQHPQQKQKQHPQQKQKQTHYP